MQNRRPTAESWIFALILGVLGYVVVFVWAIGNPQLGDGAGLVGLVGAVVGAWAGRVLGDKIADWDRTHSNPKRRR